MAGRARGVAVSNASVVVAARSIERVALVFSVGDTTNASSVVLKDDEAATVTNGIPLRVGQTLRIEGKAARHEWSAIRLAAVDCIVGVLEEYHESTAIPPPSPGVPT